MNPTLFIPAFFVAILTMGLLLLFGLSDYRVGHKAKFSFLNGFPYELYADSGLRFSILAKILVIMASFSLIIFGFGAFVRLGPSEVTAPTVMVLAGYTLSSLIFMSLFITGMRYAKLHLLLASSFFVSVAATAAAVCYFAFMTPYDVFSVALRYLAGGISIIVIAIGLNPKLKRWEKLDAVAQSDGTFIYERPKKFVLPYSEWLAILAFYALTVAVFICYFL